NFLTPKNWSALRRALSLTYLFKFGHTPRLESRFVDYWGNKLNIKKVAFLARDDAWGHAMAPVAATLSPAFCGSSSSIFCGHGVPSSVPSCLPQRHLSGG